VTARRILLGVTLAAAVLAAVIGVGRWGREQLRDDPRFAVTLDDVDFQPPPGMSRGEFLAEVRFLFHKDERFSTVDPDLGERMATLFGQHPWVAAVARTSVTGPKKVRVELRFRKPALAVPTGGGWRVVDDTGVLLPASTSSEGLRKLVGTPKSPRSPAGTPWGDPEVERQAKQSDNRILTPKAPP
jgi:hypothetical protein